MTPMARLLAWWRRRPLLRPCRYCGGTDGLEGCYACWGRTGVNVLPTVHLTPEQVPPSAFSAMYVDGGTVDFRTEKFGVVDEQELAAFVDSFGVGDG